VKDFVVAIPINPVQGWNYSPMTFRQIDGDR
jgi:hypothetical protein